MSSSASRKKSRALKIGKKKGLSLGAAAVAGIAVASSVFGGVTAANAALLPFDEAEARALISQYQVGDASTTLWSSTIDPESGTWEFSSSQELANINLNAIGYNPVDKFVYGVDPMGSKNTLYKIGQGGAKIALGDLEFEGPYGEVPALRSALGGTVTALGNMILTVVYIDPKSGERMSGVFRIDNIAKTSTPTKAIGPWDTIPGQILDITATPDGVLWAVNNNGDLLAIHSAFNTTRVVAEGILPTGAYGAAWTLPNGNVVFQNNATGKVYQIHAAATWFPKTSEAELVGVSAGNPTSQNDGTFVPGSKEGENQPDLVLTKAGESRFMVGDETYYEFTVTNKGGGLSSGWTVKDQLPAGLFDPRLENDQDGVGLQVESDGGTQWAYFTGASLKAGESKKFRLLVKTADSLADFTDDDDDPANGKCFVNQAKLWGQELDPSMTDNAASSECVIPYDSRIELKKKVAQTVDVNRNGVTDAGDTIVWTFTAKNTGKSKLTDVVIDDPMLAAAGITVTGGASELEPNDTTTFTSSPYTITTADQIAGKVENVAVAKAKSGNGVPGDPVSEKSKTTTPLEEPESNVNASASAGASAKATADGDPAAQAAAEAAATPDADTTASAAADATAKAAAESAATTTASSKASTAADSSAKAAASPAANADNSDSTNADASIGAEAAAKSAAESAATTTSSAKASAEGGSQSDTDGADAKASADGASADVNVNASASAGASAKATADGDPAAQAAAQAAATTDAQTAASAAADASAKAAAESAATPKASAEASTAADSSAKAAASPAADADAKDGANAQAKAAATADAKSAAESAATTTASAKASIEGGSQTDAKSAADGADAKSKANSANSDQAASSQTKAAASASAKASDPASSADPSTSKANGNGLAVTGGTSSWPFAAGAFALIAAGAAAFAARFTKRRKTADQ